MRTDQGQGTRLVVVTEAIEQALVSGDGSPVYGHVRESEDLVQVIDGAPAVGRSRIGTARSTGDGVRVPIDDGAVVLCLDAGIPDPTVIEVASASKDMDSRRAATLKTRTLAKKRVALLGAGSVGSAIGSLLAQAGVGSIAVVDRDRLDASNIARHLCDRDDIGREKALAVADRLRSRYVEASSLAADIRDLTDTNLDALVSSADLTVASMDDVAAQLLVNEACVRTGTPGLFVGAYELAQSGEIVVLQPGTSPCLYCFVGFRSELAPTIGPTEHRGPYRDGSSGGLTAEPGLATDIVYLSSIAAAYAIAILDPRGSRKPLLERSFALVHGGNEPRGRAEQLFRMPFDVLFGTPDRSEPCPVCGWTS